ncbi:hypothetical protein QQ045_001863 [Rhodiola kirilowii]
MEGGSAVGHLEPTPTENKARTLVLLGRAGNGKKATGNSILGRKAFKSRPSSSHLQSTILKDGASINVIDTPGLFGFSDGGTESLGKEILRCAELAEGGIHSFLVVFSVRTRFSQEEGGTLRILEALFGHKIIDYMIIIFTGGDELENMEVTLDEYLGLDCPAPLKKIIGLCSDRVVVFNNKTGDERKKNVQLQQLWSFVDLVMTQNGGKPYTDTDKPFAKSWALEVDKLTASSKHGIDQLNRLVHTSYEVQLNGMTDMIEPKLSETAKLLAKQLDEEKAARAEAEEWALESQMRLEEEMSRLRESLENERREAHVLRNRPPPPPGNRAIPCGTMGGGSVVDGWEPTATAIDACTLVLVGRTGNGKSATGNSILGKKAFKSRPSSAGVTEKCERQSTILKDGTCINVIDTPGLFDFSEGGIESIGKEIVRCLDLAGGNIHAVLVVFSIRTRFSKEEEATLESLKVLFGDKISDYMIIIFTGGDDLEDMDETMDEYLGRECPAPLKEVINYCDNRVVLFDNKKDDVTKKYAQIQQLHYFLKMVMNKNSGKPYTYKLYAELMVGVFVVFCVLLKKLQETNKLREQAKQEMDEMKRMYEEKHKELVELIEAKLRETIEMYEKQLEEEKAARANAVERAENFQCKANEELSKLREDLENARRETEELHKCQQKGNCSIL